jgi:serine/threonine-protein kinase
MARPDPNATFDPGRMAEGLGAAFDAAWQKALLGAPRPTIDEFLSRAADGERPALRAALEAIDKDYQRRMARLCSIEAGGLLADSESDATDDSPAGTPGGTVFYEEIPLVDPSATVAPTGDTEKVPADPAETIDPHAAAGDELGFEVDAGHESSAPATISPASRGAGAPRRIGPDAAVVPGYEILGVLGRGGMGVVYKAKHLRLKRIVALKMVIAGAHAGPQQLARFFIEAEAIAQLQHPNIVQVYEIGDQAGLPFFALEYVDGGCLQDKLDGKPQKPRDAARMAETLAKAMAYAHMQGIIHRDLKPANVLLTTDGEPKITDFGLAKKLEEDSSQTKSGTLMGTPHYMAPEQARGDTHDVGPLADVYALGVILYEMLTGRTPFVGTSIMETLRQVQQQEPVPPHRLQPAVPADLDTITLKCLQKDPAKRYPSADALADDLRRFLSDQPILARPVGPLERTWRWCRRNPRVAALSAAVLGLLVTVAVTSTVMAFKISAEHAEAVAARDKAIAAQELADKNAAAEKAQREIADKQAALALTTIQTLIKQVVEVQLGDEPRTQQLKINLLQIALKGLEQTSERAEGMTGSSIQATIVNAYINLGFVFKQLGKTDEAFRAFVRGHEIMKDRAQAQPTRDAAQNNLAATFVLLGDMSQQLHRDMAASLDYYRQALAIRERIYRHPHDGIGHLDPRVVREALAETYTRIGVTVLGLGDPGGSLESFRQALALRRELADEFRWDMAEAPPADEKLLAEVVRTDESRQQDLARSYNAVGEVSFLSRDRVAARDYYEKCLAVREAIFHAHPDSARAKGELANTCLNFGDIDLRSGDYAAARAHYDRCLVLYRELVDSDRQNADHQQNLADALYRVGTLARLTGDAAAAAGPFRECLTIEQDLAAKDSGNDRRQVKLMLALPHCGEAVRAAGIADKLRPGARDSEVLVELARGYALCAAAEPDHARDFAEKALDALRAAVDRGYKDVVSAETEPDFGAIRGDPRFAALLASMKAALPSTEKSDASKPVTPKR